MQDDPILQYYVPKTLSKKRLDQYLAAGWFRTGHMLFRAKVGCGDNDICSPINIRFKLEGHVFSKSLRKLYRQNQKLFRFEIRKASITDQKEQMFQHHQCRYRGSLSNSLDEFLILTHRFDTYEIAVYDEDYLVAVSFFDDGHNSMMGLLALFAPNYAKYGLGNYTMMLEIEYAKSLNKKFYYPGYVHQVPSMYDYKLRFGHAQVYDWDRKRWRNDLHPHKAPNETVKIKRKIAEIGDMLSEWGVEYKRKVYLFYSWFYYSKNYRLLFNYPLLLQLENGLIVTYDTDNDLYLCLSWDIYMTYESVKLPLAPDFDMAAHCLDVMKIKQIYFQTQDVHQLFFFLMRK